MPALFSITSRRPNCFTAVSIAFFAKPAVETSPAMNARVPQRLGKRGAGLVAIDQDHASALGRERASAGLADAVRRAGNQRDLVLQFHGCPSSCWCPRAP